MIGYRYLSSAERELNEAALFYDAAAEGLGTDFLGDIQRTIDRIRNNPQSGKALTDSFHHLLVSRFPFAVIYRTKKNGFSSSQLHTIAAARTTGNRAKAYRLCSLDWKRNTTLIHAIRNRIVARSGDWRSRSYGILP